MFAIIELNGEQYRIDDSTKQLRVAYIDGAEAGSSVAFGNVLLTEAAGGAVALGGKVKINATVASHGRDAKIIVFKKNRRKGYRKLNGHRQNFTTLDIKEFSI